VQNKLAVVMIHLSIIFYILYEPKPASNFIFCCVVELKGNVSLFKIHLKLFSYYFDYDIYLVEGTQSESSPMCRVLAGCN